MISKTFEAKLQTGAAFPVTVSFRQLDTRNLVEAGNTLYSTPKFKTVEGCTFVNKAEGCFIKKGEDGACVPCEVIGLKAFLAQHPTN